MKRPKVSKIIGQLYLKLLLIADIDIGRVYVIFLSPQYKLSDVNKTDIGNGQKFELQELYCEFFLQKGIGPIMIVVVLLHL